jgi:hypothetical protein
MIFEKFSFVLTRSEIQRQPKNHRNFYLLTTKSICCARACKIATCKNGCALVTWCINDILKVFH